jgi:hypothetical protein
VKITGPNFQRFLDAVEDDRLTHIGAAAGKDLAKSYVMTKQGSVTLDGILDYLRGFAHYGGYANYNEIERDGKKVIVLVHGFGRAGSVYISAYVKSLFELIGDRPKITSSEDSVVIEM